MFRNRYETVFIITPVLSDEQTKEWSEVQGPPQRQGANITHEENWGMRKLAYPIQKKSTGFYYLVEFDADPRPSFRSRRNSAVTSASSGS